MYYKVSLLIMNTTAHSVFRAEKFLWMEEWNQQNWKGMRDPSVPPEDAFKDAGSVLWKESSIQKSWNTSNIGFAISQAFIEASCKTAYQSPKENSSTLSGRRMRVQGHVHRNYWATFWIGPQENTENSSLVKWCHVFQNS